MRDLDQLAKQQVEDLPDTSGPAVDILHDVSATLKRLEELLYADSTLTPVSFEELMLKTGAAAAADRADAILGALADIQVQSATLGGAVAALAAGRGEDLLSLAHPDGDPTSRAESSPGSSGTQSRTR